MDKKITELRNEYLASIRRQIIRIHPDGHPNFSDKASPTSIAIALGIIERIQGRSSNTVVSEQSAGNLFEELTKDFLMQAFGRLAHLRPGNWTYSTRGRISDFDQYEHLAQLASAIKSHKELAAVLRSDYIITPDIVVSRQPISLDQLNQENKIPIIEDHDPVAGLTPLLSRSHKHSRDDARRPILHASISCKWTLRSDRSQNVRTEALNLIRNRKGNLPHIVAVTAEPLPMRIASLAMGTGELDCVYHFALYELIDAIESINNPDQKEALETLMDGRRLRDISDLPFDLAI